MKKLVCIFLLLFTAQFSIFSQSNVSNASQKSPVQQQNQVTTLKIEQSKIWVNGKWVPDAELPKSLRNLDPRIFYEAAVMGMDELTFNLNEKVFMVQNGKLIEVEMDQANNAQQTSLDKSAAESYYSQLKRESPNLFYGLSREGVLLERIRTLLFDYSQSKGKKRDDIRAEIRFVMSQLFDINERNKALEIKELEEMIKVAKDELEYRKKHKQQILDNSLENLLKE